MNVSINLTFSDGTKLSLINDHGLFSVDELKYVRFTIDTYADYIGQSFVKYDYTTGQSMAVTLIDANIEIEYVEAWSISTTVHLNHIINGMLGISTGVNGFYNFYEYDSNYKYDEEMMSYDIETYGTYSYDDWKEYIPYELFYAFNFENVKANVEKGIISIDDIFAFINEYNSLLEDNSLEIN